MKLRVQEMASTERAQPGDRIDLEVVEDVQVDGFTVIRKGAEAWGTIERASKGPGTKTEWLLYDPYVASTPLGQRREFPTRQIENGRLSFQVQGAYDITGGQVALYAEDVIGPQDHRPSWELDSATVLIWQALSYPVGKVSGKKMPSITGRHAVLSKGTEITALIDGGVCYDLEFLRRVEDMSEQRPKLMRRPAE